MDIGFEPIDDSEILFRRVPASMGWYDAKTGVLKPEAFGPHRTNDVTGLSITREKFKTIKEAARGRGKAYFVAILRAGDLRQRLIKVVPKPNLPDGEYDPAHAELPELNAATRKHSITLERQRILAEDLCLRVEGPFETLEGESA